MKLSQSLIDKALQLRQCSQYKLAQDLGIDRAFLNKVYKGDKPIPPLLAAELAAITGDDPRDAALAAELEHVSPEKRPHYERLFKMAHAAGVAAIAIGMGLAALPAQRAEAHNAPQDGGKHQQFEKDRFRHLRRRILRSLCELFTLKRRGPSSIPA